MNCKICFDENSDRIKCNLCKNSYCKNCYKLYFIHDLKIKKKFLNCIDCKIEFDFSFIMDNFDNQFTKEYNEFRAEIFFGNELKVLEEFSQKFSKNEHVKYVKNLIQRNNFAIKEIIKYTKLNYNRNIKDCKDIKEYEEYTRRIKLKEEYKKLLNFEHNLCKRNNCNGILNGDDCCLKCNFYTCRKCNVISNSILDKHICKIDDIENKNFLDNCKKCPNCLTYIIKSEGCDVMFCIICKTFFSYNECKKLYGNLHNPEYTIYMKQKNFNLIKLNCDEIRNYIDFYNNFIFGKSKDKTLFTLENLNYLICFDILQNKTRNSYLKGEIDNEKYKNLTLKRINKKLFYIEIKNLLENYFSFLSKLIYNFSNNKISKKKFENKNLSLIKEYNQHFNNIGNLFKISSPVIIIKNSKMSILKNR